VNTPFIPQSDDEFKDAFERCAIPNHAFKHRDHIRLAWIYLRESDFDGATRRLTEGIRRFASHHGSGQRYHETLTQSWARIVALAIAATPGAASVDELLATHPHLLDKGLPLKHFSSGLFWSDSARGGWVEPDLRPFPEPRTEG
jgi:hypothetical protein